MSAAIADIDVISWIGCLTEPTRLRLLHLLERSELGVLELCQVTQLPQSTTSRHLKVLADAGWIKSRRNGTTNLYRMDLSDLDDSAGPLWGIIQQQVDDWAALRHDKLRLDQVLLNRGTEGFFASAADAWDETRREAYGEGFERAALIGLLPTNWTVADLGCGTGRLVEELSWSVRRVVGVDQSAEMLKLARKRTAKRPNVALKKARVEDTKLRGSSCDAALLNLVLAYSDQPEQVLSEACRIIKPKGRLVIIDLLRHDRENFKLRMGQNSLGFEVDQLERWLKTAGFRLRGSRQLPTDSGAKGPGLLMTVATRA